MKTYTIAKALREMKKSMLIDIDVISSIKYHGNSKCQFIIDYGYDNEYLVDLNSHAKTAIRTSN